MYAKYFSYKNVLSSDYNLFYIDKGDYAYTVCAKNISDAEDLVRDCTEKGRDNYTRQITNYIESLGGRWLVIDDLTPKKDNRRHLYYVEALNDRNDTEILYIVTDRGGNDFCELYKFLTSDEFLEKCPHLKLNYKISIKLLGARILCEPLNKVNLIDIENINN